MGKYVCIRRCYHCHQLYDEGDVLMAGHPPTHWFEWHEDSTPAPQKVSQADDSSPSSLSEIQREQLATELRTAFVDAAKEEDRFGTSEQEPEPRRKRGRKAKA